MISTGRKIFPTSTELWPKDLEWVIDLSLAAFAGGFYNDFVVSFKKMAILSLKIFIT